MNCPHSIVWIYNFGSSLDQLLLFFLLVLLTIFAYMHECQFQFIRLTSLEITVQC